MRTAIRTTRPPRAAPGLRPEREHIFRIDLGRWLATTEEVGELRERLSAFRPALFRSPLGCTQVVLTVPGSDLWQATLQVMALCTQGGYAPYTVEAMPIEEYQRRRARLVG